MAFDRLLITDSEYTVTVVCDRGKLFILEPWIVKFGVKLYPPVVSDLIEEITRFYVYQQLREDIGKG